jgi:drug/metabolite transporter (DMT)-like permease
VCIFYFIFCLQIITYFMATVVISSAVAFAIFLSTPLVSIALGAFVLRELDDEPLRKKLLVAAIIGLYIVAIGTLASNALAMP